MRKNQHIYKKPIFLLLAFLIVLIPLIVFTIARISASQAASGSNIMIDYTHPVRTLDPLAVGGVDESAYGAPNVLVNDPLQQQALHTLGTKYMRINLRYTTAGDPTSALICGAQSCDTRWSGDDWVNAIKALGAQPVIEDPTNPDDLPALVKHFNKDTHNPVNRWLGGINEPNLHGQNGTIYSQKFNVTYDAMKAVDPSILIGGPTLAWYDVNFLQTFLTISGSRVDFLDFHGYAQGPAKQLAYPALFAKTAKYETDITNLYQRIRATVPGRASHIAIEVGEWDLNSAGHLLEYTPFATAWGASTIGHILRAGALDLVYADKGNLLLKTGAELPGGSLDQLTPLYHALGMYTGEGLFRHFGTTMVQASTTLPNIEVYASDNAKNIVVINTDPTSTQTGLFQLQGVSHGTVAQWSKDPSLTPSATPRLLNTFIINNGTFAATLPPFSVTTFVLDPNETPSTAVPSPTPGFSLTPGVSSSTGFSPTPVASPILEASPTAHSSPVPSGTPATDSIATVLPVASPTATGDACVGDGVYVYQDTNYHGACAKFTADIANFRYTTIGSDTASSIKIVGPFIAILYADSNYRGASSIVTTAVPNLDSLTIGSDTLSSLRVQRE